MDKIDKMVAIDRLDKVLDIFDEVSEILGQDDTRDGQDLVSKVMDKINDDNAVSIEFIKIFVQYFGSMYGQYKDVCNTLIEEWRKYNGE